MLIKYLNRPKQPIALPIEPSEPLGSSSGPSTFQSEDISSSRPTHGSKSSGLAPHSPAFDLKLARASLALEAICFATLALAPNPLVFYAMSITVSFGGGFGPAVQALALELYTRRQKALKKAKSADEGEAEQNGKGHEQEHDTGRLFGALGVVQALGQQILGPAIFGVTFTKTVGSYPGAIFWLSFACLILALLCMCLVRLPPNDSVPLFVDINANVVEGEGVTTAVSSRAMPEREATLVSDVT